MLLSESFRIVFLGDWVHAKFHQNISKIATCRLNTTLYGQTSDGQMDIKASIDSINPFELIGIVKDGFTSSFTGCYVHSHPLKSTYCPESVVGYNN